MSEPGIRAWHLYWVEGKNLAMVAESLGVSTAKLNQLWDFWGFPKRKPGPRRITRHLSVSDIERILGMVEEGMPYHLVGRRYGVTKQRVGQLVKRHRR